MAIKIAINGFGRIGRLAYRLMAEDANYEVVAINDLTKAEDLAYLLKYDTTQGRYKNYLNVSHKDGVLVDGKKEINIYAERDPKNIPWGNHDVDVVLECTGFFVDAEKAAAHITAGAKKVLISAPATGDLKTVVFNVNHDVLDGSEKVVSGASCTTNCLAPIAKAINDAFGIKQGLMTTTHAYTGDQMILDGAHPKGFNTRRGRAGAANIVPSTTGAAKAVGLVLPELKGKLDGGALRVPTATGSCVELVCQLKKDVTAAEINAVIKAAANETLGYTEDPIVSSDVIGSHFGTLFDAQCTKVMGEAGNQLVKVLTWYDNEMSYTAQLIRTLGVMAK